MIAAAAAALMYESPGETVQVVTSGISCVGNVVFRV